MNYSKVGHQSSPIQNCRAILGSNKEVVQDLLSAGALVDIPDSSGQTAFHAACAVGDMEIARMIFYKTANMNIKDIRSYS